MRAEPTQPLSLTAGRHTVGSNDEEPVHGRLRLTSILARYEGRRRMHYFTLRRPHLNPRDNKLCALR